ncbi:dehydrogenase E1 component subunit alpha/beta [Reichenbachiella carrageenanivorans]|uniref:3-methyl-2-oxobutanoate dehydrogenase (2-methylpropanoyl-transferring) n=1 Tax=Reichenbachiella carrageenanivorans TaxID=2979869 RepID=A0ABY6D2C7_9BACT|nr:dehydrogenase E1 component subunit alpha/beta [Reichenbachiella carrageenanivorans]UXX79770.1 dehydrogenase E1 component subunit alpha/beta [Reichenbachiella carrageenanivorans]
MKFDRKQLTDTQLISFYKSLLLPRLIEEKMLILLRQGKISKWFSGMGQEAISVGAALAMEPDEYILPMHRNLGIFTARNIPLHRLFAQFQGKASGFTKGRDRSFHFGSKAHHLVGMISHLGPQLGIADGIALAHKLRKNKKSTLVFTGDGGASEGDFHEALNVASVWQLPVIFVVENNCWGLSTPSAQQFNFDSFTLKGPGYGMKTKQVDGNNLLEVYHAISEISEAIKTNNEPYLIECMTFRMRGHEEASGTKYYPEGIQDQWAKLDPVDNFKQYLIKEHILTATLKNEITNALQSEIDLGLKSANDEGSIATSTSNEINDLYASHRQKITLPKTKNKTNKRFIDAISDGLRQSMQKHPEMILMGQDIGKYGGVFKITDGFVDQFGEARVRNTPLCESAILGSALGLSIQGIKSMVEMQFADFVTCGFNQIVNNLAKIHWRWGQNADVVIRMPTGAGVAAGPFHSQSNEAWFFHTPGLKIVYPSNPYDAKGLLNAAIEDPNPYLYFEHKALYRAISEEIPDDYYTVEIGKAQLTQSGNDLSIITYGMGVHWAKEIVTELDISADVLDLRTLLPWDKEAVTTTVKKTNKVIVLHEDSLTGGIGAELAAWISEHLFQDLDAPVMREGSLDTPVPFAPSLEQNFLPKDRFKAKIQSLFHY